jgi:hypothetical protein
MGQNSTWGGHPEVYAAAWFYDVAIMIYSPEYTNTGGFLVFKAGGSNGTCNTPNAVWNILYHGNNHFNGIQSPKNPSCLSQDKSDVDCYHYMQNALDDCQENFAKLAFLSYNNGTPIPPHNIKPIRATTGLIVLYIAVHLLAVGGAPISESRMKILLDQAEECVTEFVQAKYVCWLPYPQNHITGNAPYGTGKATHTGAAIFNCDVTSTSAAKAGSPYLQTYFTGIAPKYNVEYR